MKEFWNAVQFVFTAIGGWLGYFLGGCDCFLHCSHLWSSITLRESCVQSVTRSCPAQSVLRGICRKVLIFLMVGIANILDVYVIGTGERFKDGSHFFSTSQMKESPFWRMHPIWDFRFRQRSKPCWNSFMTGQKKTKTTGKGSSFPLFITENWRIIL